MRGHILSWLHVLIGLLATQSLADLNDYLAPSQICIKPVDVVEEEKVEDKNRAAVCIIFALRDSVRVLMGAAV
jgi:hypothetical protein